MSRFRRKKKMKKGNALILIIILILIAIVITFKIINKKLTPVFMGVADSEAKKFATLVINDSISKSVENNLTDDLFNTETDSSGNITSIEFDTLVVNKTLSIITNNVLLSLKQIEEGDIDSLELSDEIVDSYNRRNLEKGIIYRIPTGIIFNNSFLNNVGPKIPVKLNFMGNITSDVSTKTSNYGINNAIIEVYINLKVNIEVILPMISDTAQIKTSVPLIIKTIQGNVPEFYSGDNNPSISIPID